MERKLKQIREREPLSTINPKIQRLTKNVNSMKDIIDDLREKKILSEDATFNILMFFDDEEFEVVMNYQSGSGKCETCPPFPVRAFAMTLQFYSSRAYEYIQETYNICLPHPQRVLSWYESKDGRAGFQEEAFSALKEKSKESNGFLLCNLLMDEMDLRVEDGYDFNNKCYGLIDIGVEIKESNTSELPYATRVLAFMVVSLTDKWKIPVAYFLFKQMEGDECSNLVNLCIKKLFDAGVLIVSLTLDDCSCLWTMGSLGVPIDTVDTSTSFAHPCNPDETVSIFFDPHYMLKLLRQMLIGRKIFVDSEGNEIKWQYIKELEKVQRNKGKLFANELKEHDIQWFPGKMNAELPLHVFNNFVADGLSYCNETLKLPQFIKCSATVKFIRHVAKLFDILSSKNRSAKGSKILLCSNNKHEWEPFFIETIDYFKGIRLTDGQLAIQATWIQTVFVGFIASMVTCMNLFDTYVSGKSVFKHILCSNFSKDPLNKLVSVIRKPCTGNPPAAFLETIWKELSMNMKDMMLSKSDCCRIVSRCPSIKEMEAYNKGPRDFFRGVQSFDDAHYRILTIY